VRAGSCAGIVHCGAMTSGAPRALRQLAWALTLASVASWGPRLCSAPPAKQLSQLVSNPLHLRCAHSRSPGTSAVWRRQAARSEGVEAHKVRATHRSHRTSFPVRIDNTWYDLTNWKKKHPAGSHFIDYYEGRDATEVMYAFHSNSTRRLLASLPHVEGDVAAEMQHAVPQVSEVTRSFRLLRNRLEKEGWWERDLRQEGIWLGLWGLLFFGGVALAHLPGQAAFLAILPLTLAAVQGAWLGHDYAHGVDAFARSMRLFAPLAIGVSPTWWSDKHNKHHALTNQMGADLDISMPPLYLWTPHPDDDCPLRVIQHFWFPIGCMTVFFSWRFKSLVGAVHALGHQRRSAGAELVALVVHWAVLLLNVPAVVIGAFIAMAGLICGMIFTTSHLTEEYHEDFQHDWVSAQFCSTRDAVTRNAFTEWIWGGMQYHLEHHLFPSMPRSRYAKLAPVLKDFAEQNGIPGGYRAEDELTMFARTWEHLRRVANEPGGDVNAARLFDTSRPTGIGYRAQDLAEPA